MDSLSFWRRTAGRVQPIADFLSVLLGWSLVLLLSNSSDTLGRSVNQSLVLATVAAASTVGLLAHRGLYSGRPTLPRTDEISRVLSMAAIGALITSATVSVLHWPIDTTELVLGFVAAFSIRTVTRSFLREVGTRFKMADTRVSVVIIGVGEEAADLLHLIQDHPEGRLNVLGVIGNEQVAQSTGLDTVLLGPTERMIEVMATHGAEAAIVTATGFRSLQFQHLLRELFKAGYDVHVSTGVNRLTRSRYSIRSLAHEPLVVLQHRTHARYQFVLKRAIDIVGASVGLVVGAPLMLLTAIAIKLDDRGPVFYRSDRLGINGSTFPMIKFRSMVIDAEARKADLADQNQRSGPLFKLTRDPRVTRVGRIIRETSIDELPQLINVLRGEMSLVGPRPAIPAEAEAFDAELQSRTRVLPGITGLWQVEARSNAQFNAYRRLDLQYVENWSVWLDLRIILATVDQLIASVLTRPLARWSGEITDGVQPAQDPVLAVAPRAQRVIDLRDNVMATDHDEAIDDELELSGYYAHESVQERRVS